MRDVVVKDMVLVPRDLVLRAARAADYASEDYEDRADFEERTFAATAYSTSEAEAFSEQADAYGRLAFDLRRYASAVGVQWEGLIAFPEKQKECCGAIWTSNTLGGQDVCSRPAGHAGAHDSRPRSADAATTRVETGTAEG